MVIWILDIQFVSDFVLRISDFDDHAQVFTPIKRVTRFNDYIRLVSDVVGIEKPLSGSSFISTPGVYLIIVPMIVPKMLTGTCS